MKIRLLSIVLTILLLCLAGCVRPITDKKILDCPVPVQGCSPGNWKGLEIDTSVITSKVLGYFYKIEVVKQINSPDNEWALSFVSGKRALMTYSDRDRHSMLFARMLRPDKFSTESGLYVPIEGHTGPVSFLGDQLVFSAIQDKPADFAAPVIENYEDRKKEEFDDLSTGEFEEKYAELRGENDMYMYELPYDYMIGNSGIYSGRLDGRQIKDVAPLGRNVNLNNFSWESQPALSPDGNVIFFASDRDDGLGGTDIWYSIKTPDGSWSTAANPGVSINSNCEELTPYISQDGKKLLFASTGHETVGGYDLFSVEVEKAFWRDASNGKIENMKKGDRYFTKLKNMRPPVNTVHDELFPSSPGDIDSILYYSSNQYAQTSSILERRGGFDIFVKYKIISPYLAQEVRRKDKDIDIAFDSDPDIKEKDAQPDIKNLPYYTLEGTVFDAITREPVADAELLVKELPATEVSRQTETNSAGEYSIRLDKDKEFEVTAQAKDLFFDSFKLLVDKNDTITKIRKDFFLPHKLDLRINFPLDKFSEPYRFSLDTNGIETDRSWGEEINLLVQNIMLYKDKLRKIVLVGHTDYLGTARYNKGLGQRRVDFIIAELVRRGVPSELLEGRSAGESEMLPRKESEDEKLYRKRLRRVTLEKILKN